jgi:putative membrane-bound dehydrogenase-like protein
MNSHFGPVLLLSLSLVGHAAEPTLSSNDLPRFPAIAPRDALKTFRVKKGFHIELVACEPDVVSPVALSFDENGRMFVVEMIDYSERRDAVPHLGRIRLLEDTDGDGVFDKSTVFADNLAWPTAVFCYGGGVFVGATPDILYLKDTDGDGKADVREVVFTGFAEGVTRINVQEMLNSFIWGLDNQIHGATSGEGGSIKSLRHPEAPRLDLRGRDFVIDPRAMTMTSEAGGGQHGLSFDDPGRRFTCNNNDHIRLFEYDERYAARNPFYAMPPPLASVAVDGPAAEVYRASPDEPWRMIRTRWRVAGLVSGPIEGGGRASGYFTGATGITIYRGNAYPPEFLDNAFVGECAGNLIHRKLLLADGVSLKAERPSDEQKTEFIASTDTWFRPVQFANAPDGTLYVIDMHREIVEHPWSLPDNIKKFLDLNSGSNLGRIYRIAPDGFKRPPRPQLGKASTAELVGLLEHPNGWHRDTAARLLFERQDATAVPLLAALLSGSKSPLGRLHALCALEGLGGFQESHVLTALNDPDAGVRQHAVRLSERFFPPSAQLLAKLQQLADDPSILVRYQLAFTLGELKDNTKVAPLTTIVRRDQDSAWTQAAILSSLNEGAGELFAALANDSSFCTAKACSEFLRQLLVLVAARNDPQEVARAVAFIDKVQEPANRFALVGALGDGFRRAGQSVLWIPSVKETLALATRTAVDETTPELTRVEAIRLLALTDFAEAGKLLLALLEPNESQPVQLAAMDALDGFAVPQVGQELTARWENLSPHLRSEALAVLLARPERAVALLKSIQAGMIRPSVLTTSQVKFLRTHSNTKVRELATQVLSTASTSNRQQVIESFMPSLKLSGQAANGKKVYEERCISCHRLGGEGYALGPDLVTVKNTGREKIMVNILDPNREVRPEYVSYVVQTKDDESHLGLLIHESATTVTVLQAFGKEEVILRPDIKKIQSQNLSLMPEGLEVGLSSQDLADLLSYIETAQPESSRH